ncbi:MAG: hypothetical protein LBG91_01955, partial [Treponema sp.]|nr:hypothetical protein [Treponema sp.]
MKLPPVNFWKNKKLTPEEQNNLLVETFRKVFGTICVNLRRIKNTKLRYPLAFRVSAKIRQAGQVFFQTFGF